MPKTCAGWCHASRRKSPPVTANFFLSKYSTLLNKDIYGFSANALRQLNDYAWPGNVRELENLVERIVNLSDAGDILDVAAFPCTGQRLNPTREQALRLRLILRAWFHYAMSSGTLLNMPLPRAILTSRVARRF